MQEQEYQQLANYPQAVGNRPSVRKELEIRKERLTKELSLIDAAILQLDQIPEIEKLLDLFRKIGV